MRAAYVYYRIDPARAEEAAGCVDALLSAMTPHCAMPPRRLCRCDDADTWMEIYEGIADWSGFSAALAQAVLNCGVVRHVLGERHLECFGSPGKMT